MICIFEPRTYEFCRDKENKIIAFDDEAQAKDWLRKMGFEDDEIDSLEYRELEA